jgi:hypothetical protein
MHWVYQVNWHVYEAMVWVMCWLNVLILAQQWHIDGQAGFFINPHHPN